MNLFFLDFPQYKLSIHLNGGFNFGQTLLTDTLRTLNQGSIINSTTVAEEAVNTTDFYYKVNLEILPDSRYGLELGFTQHYFDLQNPSFVQADNLQSYKDSKIGVSDNRKRHRYGKYYIEGFLSNSKSNRFFIRYEYYYIINDYQTNFEELKIGYSFNIISNSSSK